MEGSWADAVDDIVIAPNKIKFAEKDIKKNPPKKVKTGGWNGKVVVGMSDWRRGLV
jgi:hypothetical protein